MLGRCWSVAGRGKWQNANTSIEGNYALNKITAPNVLPFFFTKRRAHAQNVLSRQRGKLSNEKSDDEIDKVHVLHARRSDVASVESCALIIVLSIFLVQC